MNFPFFFHVEQVFPQCRGLRSSLGTPQIASTDRYWVYPSAFSNRALNHPMVKCARKKLKQEPDRSTNQISEKRSPFSLGLKAYTNQRSEKKNFDRTESTKSERNEQVSCASVAFKLVSLLP